MSGFTTDFQIIPASALQTPGTVVQPSLVEPILSILPGTFAISADTARLIARLTTTPATLRLAA